MKSGLCTSAFNPSIFLNKYLLTSFVISIDVRGKFLSPLFVSTLNVFLPVVSSFTKAHKSVLVLKGASTLVGSTDYDDIYVNSTGNPGMATGGSGDVLSGIIASFVAQGIDPFTSAVAGVNVHGMIGDKVTEKYSMMGNTPTLMLNELPLILKKFE